MVGGAGALVQKLKDTGSYLKGVWQRLNGGGGGDWESLVDLPAPQTTQKADAQARQVREG
jgi:hypothetical protein